MMTPMGSGCPYPGCTKSKPREQYACRHHWLILPRLLRAKIWAGYRGDPGSNWNRADQEAREFYMKREKIDENDKAATQVRALPNA